MIVRPASIGEIFTANRARGLIDLSVEAVDQQTRRQRVLEEGSFRIRFPNTSETECEAVIVNTAGGIAGGDKFKTSIAVGTGAQLAITTASAEKVYRAIDGPADMDVRLQVAAGAVLRWLPQETILFDEACLHRNITVELHEDARLVLAEAVIFGRAAMRETVRRGELIDRWRIRRDGRMAFAETLRLEGDMQALMSRSAAGGGAVALATAIIAPGSEAIVESVRGLLQDCASEGGVSAWNGITVLRLCSRDAAALRRDLVSVLNAVAGTLPRLWTN